MPVQYTDSGKFTSTNVAVKRVWYVTTTALVRGAVVIYAKQAAIASFDKGPGVDVILSAGTDAELFAGIIADDSIGFTGPGYINIQVPYVGDVVWCRCASGIDNGDGITMQASSTDQGFADSGAYADVDMGVCLMDEDGTDAPYAADNLAPILFTNGQV
jgi:hypothetical protein